MSALKLQTSKVVWTIIAEFLALGVLYPIVSDRAFPIFATLAAVGLSGLAFRLAKLHDQIGCDLQDTLGVLDNANEQNKELLEDIEEYKQANVKLTQLHVTTSNDIETLKRSTKQDIDSLTEQLQKTTDESIIAIESLLATVKQHEQTIEKLNTAVHEIDLTCAYCNTKQPVLFNIASGEFTCRQCNNINAIHTNVYTARTNTLLN